MAIWTARKLSSAAACYTHVTQRGNQVSPYDHTSVPILPNKSSAYISFFDMPYFTVQCCSFSGSSLTLFFQIFTKSGTSASEMAGRVNNADQSEPSTRIAPDLANQPLSLMHLLSR